MNDIEMIERPQEAFPQIMESQINSLRSQKYTVDQHCAKRLNTKAENSVEPNSLDNNEEENEREMRYREKLTLLIQVFCGIVMISFIIGYFVCFIYFVAFKVRLDET